MLDSLTERRTGTAVLLKGQRVLVLGACCGFGRGMVRELAASGAQVIAADANAPALSQIEGAMTLTLKGVPSEALRRVGRAWGEARLDAVLNLMPLRHPAQIDLNIAVLQSAVQGFMPALSAREGQILSVVARPEQPLDVAAGAMAPALLSAQGAFVSALRRDGLSLNMISMGEGAQTPARRAVIGMLSRALGPVTGAELRL